MLIVFLIVATTLIIVVSIVIYKLTCEQQVSPLQEWLNDEIHIDMEHCIATRPYCSHYCWFGSEYQSMKILLDAAQIREKLEKEGRINYHFL